MNYKVRVNPKVLKSKMINPDLSRIFGKSRLQEVGYLLRSAILRIRLRERNKLINKI